jgi:hypothetical protein
LIYGIAKQKLRKKRSDENNRDILDQLVNEKLGSPFETVKKIDLEKPPKYI